MQQKALKILIFVFFLLGVLSMMERPQAVAHGRSAHDATASTIFPTVLPEHAKQLLAAMAPLGMARQNANDVNVKASVLCFCLHKAGATIEELRRIQAEWFNKGKTSFEAHNYTEAITAFTRLIEMNMRDARVYTNRGLSYARRGDYQQALRDLTRAIDLNHHQAEAYYARGLIAFIMHDIAAAQRNLQTASQLNDALAQQVLGLEPSPHDLQHSH